MLRPAVQSRPLALLRERGFRSLWLATGLSSFGDWFNVVALNLFVYGLNHNPFDVSILLVSQMVPAIVLSPFLGSLVDRSRERAIAVIAANLASAALCVALLAVTSLAAACAVAASIAVLGSITNAGTSSLLRRAQWDQADAVRINQFTYYLVSVAGPALAAVLVSTIGFDACFLVNGGSFLIAALGTRRFVAHTPQVSTIPEKSDERRPIGLRAATAYLIRDALVLRTVLIGTGLIMLGGGATGVLEVVFAERVLDLGSAGYGAFLAAYSVGMLVGAGLLLFASRSWRPTLVYSAGICVCGAAAALTAIEQERAAIFVTWAIAGMGTAWFNTERRTIIQIASPPNLIGFVVNTNTSLYTAGYLISALGVGALSAHASVRTLFFSAALIILATGLWSAVRLRGSSTDVVSTGAVVQLSSGSSQP